MERTRLLLDTSAVFAGVWSSSGGARELLKLGEAGAVQLVVSKTVLAELEGAFARKAPSLLPRIALLLDAAEVEVSEDENADYFVTLDRKHFLENTRLKKKAPFPIDTPGACLGWVRDKLAKLTRMRGY